MIRVLFVAIAFLSVSAMAEPGPCSAGFQDPPIFSLVVSNPVRVTFSDTVHAVLSPPLLTIEGSRITLVQTAYETLVAPPASCNRQSVPLDDLAPGSYTLTWKYQTLQNFTLETYSFAFTVPEASPCVAGVSIQPQSRALASRCRSSTPCRSEDFWRRQRSRSTAARSRSTSRPSSPIRHFPATFHAHAASSRLAHCKPASTRSRFTRLRSDHFPTPSPSGSRSGAAPFEDTENYR